MSGFEFKLLRFRPRKYDVKKKIAKKVTSLYPTETTDEIIMNKNIESKSNNNNNEKMKLHDVLANSSYPIHVKITNMDESLRLENKPAQSEVLTVYESKSFERVKCLTKHSAHLYIPLNLPKPVMYTSIDSKELDMNTTSEMRRYTGKRKTLWLVVTNEFVYNSRTYEVGEILEVVKPSMIKRLLRLLANKRTRYDITVLSHLMKDKNILPTYLRGNMKMCSSPYSSCYRLISDLMKTEKLPFLITVPVNPLNNKVLNDGKVTTTKDNQRLLVLEKESYDVIIANDENKNAYDYILPADSSIEVEIVNNRTSTKTPDIVERRKAILNSIDETLKKREDASEIITKPSTAVDTIAITPKSEKSQVFTFPEKKESTSSVLTTYLTSQPSSPPELLSFKRINSSHNMLNTNETEILPIPPPRKKRTYPKGQVGHCETNKFSKLPPTPTEEKENVQEGYLVPITGFMQQHLENKTHYNIDECFIEVGTDGYVLVPKRHVVKISPSMKRHENKIRKSRDADYTMFNNLPGMVTNNIDFEQREQTQQISLKPTPPPRRSALSSTSSTTEMTVNKTSPRSPIPSPRPSKASRVTDILVHDVKPLVKPRVPKKPVRYNKL